MLKDSQTYSGFSVSDIAVAKEFYGTILGLDVTGEQMGLSLNVNGQNPVFVYTKPNHVPATFTILNFVVADVEAAVDELSAKGVVFEKYADMPYPQDEKGILRGKAANQGPDIAWFKDPSGNILSVLTD